MDNPGMGRGKADMTRDAAAIRAFVDEDNQEELPEDEMDREPEEDARPEDFEPFKDPKKLKQIKKETPPPSEE